MRNPRIPPQRITVGTAVLLASMVACAPAGDAGEAYQISDSAGVRVVRYLTEPEAPVWSAVEPAALHIGGEDDFDGITNAVFFGDGAVLTADARAARLSLFDGEGRLIKTLGRAGDGPLEFRNLAWARRHRGDSIATYDRALRRVLVFDTAGGIGRTIPLHPTGDGANPTALIVLGDGAIAASAEHSLTVNRLAPGIHAGTMALWRYRPDGTPEAAFRSGLKGDEWVQLESPQILLFQPFRFGSILAASPTRVFVADSGSGQVDGYDAGGSLVLRVHLPPTARPVTEQLRQRDREQRLAPYREPGRETELIEQTRIVDQLPYPANFPAVRRLVIDRDDRLWVQEFPAPGETRLRYLVLGPDGVILARFETPERTQLFDAQGDRVLLRWRDEDDRDFVRVYHVQ